MSKPRIIAIVSLKGGVGKTTSAVNIAASIAESGKKTLIVDLDPHTGASLHLGYKLDEFENTISDILINQDMKLNEIIIETGKKNIFLIPSNSSLNNIENEIETEIGKENLLLRSFDKQVDEFDYIIIDSPPMGSYLLFSVLKVANFILLPFRTNYMSVKATKDSVELLKKVQHRINPDLKILGYFGTMFDKRTIESKESLGEMRKEYSEKTFMTTIPINTDLSKAARKGASAIECAKRSKGALAYNNLVKEIFRKLKKMN